MSAEAQTIDPKDGAADPNVRIPEHVAAAGASADALHQQFYPKNPEQPPAPAKEAAPQPENSAPGPTPAEVPVTPSPPLAPEQNVGPDEWRHRFLSMQGRYQAKAREVAGMEEQMTALGRELVATQNMVAQLQQGQQQQPNQKSPHHANLITDEDRANYGDELLDVMTRAARATVQPEIEALRAHNAELTQRVQHTGKRELFATLDGRMPNWRKINTSPQFISWLLLPNIYTGQVRQQMLNDAVDGADAPKVIAMFRDFLAEVQATGQQVPTVQHEQQAQPAPRTPALDLGSLAAPGRARPASGDSQVPSEKPVFTRAQISTFYSDSRKGLFAGREAEYRATEVAMQEAMREGRVR